MLEKVNFPSDLKKLNKNQLIELCHDIREKIISTTYKCGGHLASNLGVVELTTALHYVFNTPQDKLIFDVGHQCYAHKILTGRKKQMDTIRQQHGLSGFTNPSESPYDVIWAGHSSTSLSEAIGFCRARDIKGEDYNVIAVIGDASLSSGMAFEALNDIGSYANKLIIILNDNEMSIEKNVGALSSHLSKLRISPKYTVPKKCFTKILQTIPLIGKPLKYFFEKIKNMMKRIFIKKNIFDAFGIQYTGVYDGNDIGQLIKTFKLAKNTNKPILIHLRTKKGKGYQPAEKNPVEFHGVKKGFEKNQPVFSAAFGEKLTSLAEKNENIVAITAAMKDGTGLKSFADEYPQKFFDVGICEQHAVTMSSGMANGGLKPYFAVYSTFLQRAFDQISNDICLPKLPVTLVIDRAGLCGSDGETHHGVLDIAYLTCLPNITVYAPRDIKALNSILDFSVHFGGPLAIRYENDYFYEFENDNKIQVGKWQEIKEIAQLNILTYGNRLLTMAYSAAKRLDSEGVKIGVIDAAFIKPIDNEMLSKITGKLIIIEDSLPNGSLFSIISSHITKNSLPIELVSLTIPDKYLTHGSSLDILKDYGISEEHIITKVKSILSL